MAAIIRSGRLRSSVGISAVSGSVTGNSFLNTDYNLKYGTGTSTANTIFISKEYYAAVTLGAGLDTTIDLRSLTDDDGSTITFSTINGMCFKNIGTGVFEVGDSGANGFVGYTSSTSDVLVIRAASTKPTMLQIVDPVGTSTSAGSKDLKIKNTSGGSATLYLRIVGK